MNLPYTAIVLFCLFSIRGKAQSEPATRNSAYIFWQPGVEIRLTDYQDTIHHITRRMNEVYGMDWNANIGIRSAVDLPRKKKERRKKPEIAYFGAVFCRNCSSYLTEDSTQLKHDRIFFDIAELCTRKARKEMESISRIIPAFGVKSIFLQTITNEMNELLFDIIGAYRREVLAEKKEGAYEEWAKIIADLLRATREYATKPEDCIRLLNNEAMGNGYFSPKQLIGDFRNSSSEKEREKPLSGDIKSARDYIENVSIPNESLSLPELRALNVQKIQKTSSGHLIKSEFFQKGVVKNILDTFEKEGVVLLTLKSTPVPQCVLLGLTQKTILRASGKEVKRYSYFYKVAEEDRKKPIREKNIRTVYYIHR